jgi:hypothetical protein
MFPDRAAVIQFSMAEQSHRQNPSIPSAGQRIFGFGMRVFSVVAKEIGLGIDCQASTNRGLRPFLCLLFRAFSSKLPTDYFLNLDKR